MESAYAMALATGLLGGTHCIGMCGPIVATCALGDENIGQGGKTSCHDLIQHFLYNTGRTMSYAFIGAVMGYGGSFLSTIAGMQNLIAIAAGLFMISVGVQIIGIIPGTGWLEIRSASIMKAGRGLLNIQSKWKYYILGSVFGFLPCGLSYSVFAAAAGSGSLLSGMLIALTFGLGTFPWLMLFGAFTSFLSIRMRGLMYRASGIVVTGMGILFLVRGIRLHASL